MAHVLLVAPEAPERRPFLRGLERLGARVTGLGEQRPEQLDTELRYLLADYEPVERLADEEALCAAVQRVQARGPWVDRLETLEEAHLEVTARVRERCTIPGPGGDLVALTRDKFRLKRFLADHAVSGAPSLDLGDGVPDAEAARAFAHQVGYPVVVKPRVGTGNIDSVRVVDDDTALRAALDEPPPLVMERFVDGHEGFLDGLILDGRTVLQAVTHFYPSVRRALTDRSVSPIAVHSNRLSHDGYDDLRALNQRVVSALGLDRRGTLTATHLEWFHGRDGLWFSGLDLHPSPFGFWGLYGEAAQLDWHIEWARALCEGAVRTELAEHRAAGLVNLRPDRDGVVSHYEGIERMQRAYGSHIFRLHLPPPSTPTQPISAGYLANAYVGVAHPDYDTLREILADIGNTVRVVASDGPAT
ncbi:MAG: ATPase [Myxococcota bacterium]